MTAAPRPTRHLAGRGATLPADRLAGEFDATAPRYDRMVALNPGYHAHLRDAARALADRLPRRGGSVVVDLGCGSGASTAQLVAAVGPQVRTVGIDASAGMLAATAGKAWPPDVRFVHGAAGELRRRGGEWGLPEHVDGVLACYLFRNVPDVDAAPADVFDTLAPGGVLVVQDYTLTGSLRTRLIWTAVCWLIVIPLSMVLTGRTALYRYLWRSALRFDSPTRLSARLTAAGFEPVVMSGVTGWQRGILHTVVAHKPAR